MNFSDIANLRLHLQQISGTKLKTAKDLVGWMGVMQAQDYAMSKWALGVRLPNSSDSSVESAIHNGDVIRTHLLRPTWHLVSPDDIYWMLELSAPQIKTLMRSRNRDLELTPAVFAKSNAVMEKALRGGEHLRREELVAELNKASIATDENRASHIFVNAELDGILCSGTIQKGKPTYTLLEERVPRRKSLTKETSLAALAGRYFASHGPATLQDFAWWSGLSANDARQALEMTKPDLAEETVDDKTYWLSKSFSTPKDGKDSIHFLPAYDEFIISYADRSAVLPSTHHKKTISSNGIFKPTIVINGQVRGIWKRTFQKDKVVIETDFFERPDNLQKSLVEKAALSFGDFLEKKIEITI